MAEMHRLEANIKKLGDVALFLGVKVSEEFESLEVTGLSTSSNRIRAGELFIALPGEKHHGIKQAFDNPPNR